MPVPLFLGGLREEFISGDQGDCTLKFVVGGEVVAERKAESNILRQVPHFKRQLQFEEGKTKVFTIDISDFMEDVTISAKEFVEVSLLVLFDGDVKIEQEIDLASRFGIMKFREYLELPYSKVLVFDCDWPEENAQENRKFVIHMIKNCSLSVCATVVKTTLVLLEKEVSELKQERDAGEAGDAADAVPDDDEDGEDKEFDFHEKWKVAYELMLELLQGDSDSEQRGVIILRNLLSDDFSSSTKQQREHLTCLGGGVLELATLATHYNIDGWSVPHGASADVQFSPVWTTIFGNIMLFVTVKYAFEKVPVTTDVFSFHHFLKSDSIILAMEKYKHSRIASMVMVGCGLSSCVNIILKDLKKGGNRTFFEGFQVLVSNESIKYSHEWQESMRGLQKENEELKKALSEAGQSSSSQVGTKRRRVD